MQHQVCFPVVVVRHLACFPVVVVVQSLVSQLDALTTAHEDALQELESVMQMTGERAREHVQGALLVNADVGDVGAGTASTTR